MPERVRDESHPLFTQHLEQHYGLKNVVKVEALDISWQIQKGLDRFLGIKMDRIPQIMPVYTQADKIVPEGYTIGIGIVFQERHIDNEKLGQTLPHLKIAVFKGKDEPIAMIGSKTYEIQEHPLPEDSEPRTTIYRREKSDGQNRDSAIELGMPNGTGTKGMALVITGENSTPFITSYVKCAFEDGGVSYDNILPASERRYGI